MRDHPQTMAMQQLQGSGAGQMTTVSAITTLMISDMFADHELPVDDAVRHKYEDLARKILTHLRVEPQSTQAAARSGAGQVNDLVKRLRSPDTSYATADEAADRIEALEAVVRFYATVSNYISGDTYRNGMTRPVMQDSGEIARTALAPEQDK